MHLMTTSMRPYAISIAYPVSSNLIAVLIMFEKEKLISDDTKIDTRI